MCHFQVLEMFKQGMNFEMHHSKFVYFESKSLIEHPKVVFLSNSWAVLL